MRLVWPVLFVSGFPAHPGRGCDWQDDSGDRRQGLGLGFLLFTTTHEPLAERVYPGAHSGCGGGESQGGIPVKKIAVRVTALGGGIVAVLLAGAAGLHKG